MDKVDIADDLLIGQQFNRTTDDSYFSFLDDHFGIQPDSVMRSKLLIDQSAIYDSRRQLAEVEGYPGFLPNQLL